MSGAVFTLGNSVSGSLGLGDALSKFGRVAVTGLTIEQDPDTVNSYLTTRYAGLSAVTSGGVTTFLNPSLVVIPSAYNNGIVYSLHSKQVNTGDFTVTRNTEARRVNSAGRIASIGSGLPRLDYLTSGGTVGTPALLVEPAATNLCLQSEDFNTTWGKINLNVSTNATATTDPAGGNTADLLTVISGSTQAESSQAITTVSGTAYVFSFFGKKGSGATDLNSFRVISSNITTVTINWDTGVLTQTGTPSSGATAQNFGNGWWRISIPFTAGSTSTTVQVCSFNTFPAGQNSYRWGAQLETGSVATSYIPTTTGSVTRNADVISVTGAVSGSIGQTEGTAYFEIDFTQGFKVATGFNYLLTIRSSASQWVIFYIRANGNIAFEVANTSPAVSLGNNASGTITNGIFKVAGAYKSGEYALYVNGVQVGTSASTGVPTSLTQIGFHSEGGPGNNTTFGRVRALALYTTRLTNDELKSLTTL